MIKFREILAEIGINRPLHLPRFALVFKEKLQTIQNNGKSLNLRIGKYNVDRGQKGFEYSWQDAISKKLISSPTIKRSLEIFNKLEITPEKVYIGYYIYNNPTYIGINQNLDNNKITYSTAAFIHGYIPDNSEFKSWDGSYHKVSYIKLGDISVNYKSTYILGFYNGEPVLCVQRQTHNQKAGQFYVYSQYRKSEKGAWADSNLSKEEFLEKYGINDNI